MNLSQRHRYVDELIESAAPTYLGFAQDAVAFIDGEIDQEEFDRRVARAEPRRPGSGSDWTIGSD